MPEPRTKTTTRAPGARTRPAAKAGPAFAADDEKPGPMLDGITIPKAGGKIRYQPTDRSLEAVTWRQEEHERQSGLAFDPVTMMRVVNRPNGRGGYSKQLREVEMDSDLAVRQEKAAAGGKDYWHPDAGWMRGGTKRETDSEALREDNVFGEGD